MPFNKPVKVIASVPGKVTAIDNGELGSGVVFIVDAAEPESRPDNNILQEGDFWFDITKDDLYVFIDDFENTGTGWRRSVPEVVSDEVTLSNPLVPYPGGAEPAIIPPDLFPVDYPSPFNRLTQGEANDYFLQASFWALNEIEKIKGAIIAEIDFRVEPDCGLQLDEISEEVYVWSFDMRELNSIQTSNPYINSRVTLPSQIIEQNPSLFLERVVTRQFDSILPIDVRTEMESSSSLLTTHSFNIPALDNINNDQDLEYKIINKIDHVGNFTFAADAPMTTYSSGEVVTHGFLISTLTKL